MTATDDALMAAVRAYGLAHCASVKERPDPGLESTVRAAAIAYGRAVAIEACEKFILNEKDGHMHGVYIAVRMEQYIKAQLRAADSTGGDG